MRLRSGLVAGLAATLLLVVAAPGYAGPSPSPSPSPSQGASPGSQTAPGDDGNRAWSIRPASPEGRPDSRTHFTLQAVPGGTLTDQVLVTNVSKVAATFSIYATDAFNTATGDFDLLAASVKPVDIGSWVSFAAPTITIPAGASVAVPFTIKVPKNATPGDHAGGVVVSLVTGTNVRLDTRVATRLYLRVAGYLRPMLAVAVDAGYVGGGSPFGRGKVTITYTVSNPGNIRLRSHPKAKVTAWFGATLGSVTLPDLPELLPGQRATFSTVVDHVFPYGPLTASVDLQPYPDPAQPVGQSVPRASGDATVWAVSGWLVFLLIIFLLLVGAFGWYLFVRRRQRRYLAELAARKQARKPALVGTRAGGAE